MKKINWDRFLSIGSFILSILGVFVSLIGNPIAQIIGVVSAIVSMICILIFAVRRYFSIKKIKSNIKRDMENRYTNLERDLNENRKSFSNIIKNGIVKMSHPKSISEDDLARDICKICTEINDHFSKYLRAETNVCIKRIRTESIVSRDIYMTGILLR